MMSYDKPEIAVLGGAEHVIQVLGKCVGETIEGPDCYYNPAYDLDE